MTTMRSLEKETAIWVWLNGGDFSAPRGTSKGSVVWARIHVPDSAHLAGAAN